MQPFNLQTRFTFEYFHRFIFTFHLGPPARGSPGPKTLLPSSPLGEKADAQGVFFVKTMLVWLGVITGGDGGV